MFDPVCIIMIRINCCFVNKGSKCMFWIITALTFIGIPTAITIECLIGFSIVFTQKGQIRQPPKWWWYIIGDGESESIYNGSNS